MTDLNLNLVRSTWASVLPIADQAAELFFARLFEIAPKTKPLFAATDMGGHKAKLLAALNLAVEHADDPQTLVPVLEELGRRHVGYGVENAHYDAVGEALLWTLEQGLGEAFTDEARAAWADVYALVSCTMKGAAAQMMETAA